MAWVLSRGRNIRAIPGSTSVEHLDEDFAAPDIRLSPNTMERLDALINVGTVSGARYASTIQAEIDTEEITN